MPVYGFRDPETGEESEFEFKEELSDEQLKEFYAKYVDSGKGRPRSAGATFGREVGVGTGQAISGGARGASSFGEMMAGVAPGVDYKLAQALTEPKGAPPEQILKPLPDESPEALRERTNLILSLSGLPPSPPIPSGLLPSEAPPQFRPEIEDPITKEIRARAVAREAALAQDPIYKAGQQLAEGAREAFQPNVRYQNEWFASKIPSAFGSTFPSLAATALTGGTIGPILGGLQYGLSQGQSEAEAAIAAGHPEEADFAFWLNTAIGGTTEGLLGVGPKFYQLMRTSRQLGLPARFLGDAVEKWAKLNPVKGAAIEGALGEFTQEGLEQFAQNVIARFSYDPNRPLTQDVVENAILGALVGGPIGAGAGVIGKFLPKEPGEATREGTDRVVQKAATTMPRSSATVSSMQNAADLAEPPALTLDEVKNLRPGAVTVGTPAETAAAVAGATALAEEERKRLAAEAAAKAGAAAPAPAGAIEREQVLNLIDSYRKTKGLPVVSVSEDSINEITEFFRKEGTPDPKELNALLDRTVGAGTRPPGATKPPAPAPTGEATPESIEALAKQAYEAIKEKRKSEGNPFLSVSAAFVQQQFNLPHELAVQVALKAKELAPPPEPGKGPFTMRGALKAAQRREQNLKPYRSTDELVQAAQEFLKSQKTASIKPLRDALKLSFTEAGELMAELEARGIVGPSKAFGGRAIIRAGEPAVEPTPETEEEPELTDEQLAELDAIEEANKKLLAEQAKPSTEGGPSAVQEPTTVEGVLRRPEAGAGEGVGLRGVGEEKPTVQEPAEEKPPTEVTPPPPATTPEGAAPAPPPAPAPAPAPAPPTPAAAPSKNVIFTEDAYQAALAEMREMMKGVGAGVDPKWITVGVQIAGYHIEKGFKKFADFAAKMIEVLGEKARPYLKMWYNAVRDYPDFDATGMDDAASVNAQFETLRRPAGETPPAPPAPAPAPTPATEDELIDRASDAIASRLMDLSKGPSLGRQEAAQIVGAIYGGTMASGRFSSKDLSDIVELAINKVIRDNPTIYAQEPDAVRAVRRLKGLIERSPTQTTRTAETDKLQQFSTPPPLAYVANWVANIDKNDVVLEPSAGIGGLAVFPHAAGAEVITNELSDRRRKILDRLKISAASLGMNAEHMNALLRPRIDKGEIRQPTVVVMNPPFSQGAVSGEKSTRVGAQHLEEALKLVPEGGRVVAIVGEGMAADRPAFKDWWRSISQKYTVKANIGVSGKEYRKYGTTFGNQILVIDKTGPTPPGTIITGNVDLIEDLVTLLETIRDDRQRPRTERPSPQPSGAPPPQGGQGPVSPPPNVSPPTGSVPSGGPGLGTTGGGGPGVAPGPPGSTQPTGVSGAPGATGQGAATPQGGPDVGGGAGTAGGGISGIDSGLPPPTDTHGVTVERQKEAERKLGGDGSIFTNYVPAKIRVEGALPHPSPLVESTAMAAVEPPDPTYKPKIPTDFLTTGKLSEAQLEQILYAGQAHQQMLPSGERAGHMTGDGTGVGKGRIIAGMILDNYNHGRRKAVWITKTRNLIEDAKRDVAALGMNPDSVFGVLEADQAKALKNLKEGIAFLTYKGLSTDNPGLNQEGKLNPQGRTNKKGAQKYSRMEALRDWLPADYDGLIAFDEVHLAGRAIDVQGTFGQKNASQMGLAVVQLQKMFPNARIEYVSATGASSIEGLSFADRLGIWGGGTPFADKRTFFQQISAGGLSALEIIAQNLKALGKYLARTLSFEGVNQRGLKHNLTPDQKTMYDTFARTWQEVVTRMDQTMAQTGQANNSRARSAARSAFYGAQQRAFNTLLTALQMPSIIADAREQLAAGNSVVMQLVNTNKAQQDREMAEAASDEEFDIEEVDLSPRGILRRFLEESYPTELYEAVMDANGNVTWQIATDPVTHETLEDPVAVAEKQRLIDQLDFLKLPENPLEMVLNTFGWENVAEVTGRNTRIVEIVQPDGTKKRDTQTGRTNEVRLAEAKQFNAGDRRILIFSDAGGTGFSYHAGRDFKNQQRRIHYLVQAGWSADKAIQGFGRTHRSNERVPPEYVMVSTDIRGHERFMATIARRLGELGALTGGERKSAGSGLFDGSNQIETDYGEDAVTRLFYDLFNGRVEGYNFDDISRRMGYIQSRRDPSTGDVVTSNILINARTGKLNDTKLPSIQQFLNRVLMLEYSMQNNFFDEFMDRLQRRIDNAMADGSYDPGLQTVKALAIRVVSDEVVYEHPSSTATTRLVTIEADLPTTLNTWDERNAIAPSTPVTMYVKSRKNGRAFALKEGPPRTLETGSVVPTWRRIYFRGADIMPKADISTQPSLGEEPKYDIIPEAEAKTQWDSDYAAAPRSYASRQTYIVGLMLPIWDRIKLPKPTIWRINTTAGPTLLGVRVPEKLEPAVRDRLGAKVSASLTPEIVANRILMDGDSFNLVNGWRLKKSRVNGEDRIEVTGLEYSQMSQFETYYGGFMERISWKSRFFVPTEPTQIQNVLGKILNEHPIIPTGGNASVGSGSRITEEDAHRAIDLWRAASGSQANVTLIDAPEWHEDGVGVRAYFDENGNIYLNIAHLGSITTAVEVLNHEGAHELLATEDGQKAIQDFVLRLSPAELSAVGVHYRRRSDESEAQYKERLAEEFIAKAAEKSASMWQRFLDWIREWLAKAGLANLTNEEVARAVIADLNERRRIGNLPTIKPPTGGRYALASVPSPTVEFSDTGPTITMEGQRELSQALSWINEPYAYRTQTNAGLVESARKLVDPFRDDMEAALAWLKQAGPMTGITDSIRIATASEIANRAAAQMRNTPNPVDALRLRATRNAATVYAKTALSAQGQGLNTGNLARDMMGAGAFVAEYEDLLRRKQEAALKGKFPEVVSDQIRAWLNKVATDAIANLKDKLQAADVLVSRALNQERRNMGQTWHDILTQAAVVQGDQRKAIYRAVRTHPLLVNLAESEALELTNLLNKAWTKEWATVAQREFDKVVKVPRASASDKAKLKESVPDLIKWINLGLLSFDRFRETLAVKYGVKRFSEETARTVYEMAQQAQAAPFGSQRGDAYQEVFKYIQSEGGLTASELLWSYWYASILSGVGTQGRNLMGNFGIMMSNFLALSAREPMAFPVIVGGLLRGMRMNATGDLPAILKRGSRPIREGFTYGDEADAQRSANWAIVTNPLEAGANDARQWVRFLSNGRYVGRFMIAADSSFYQANAEMKASFDAFRAGKEDPNVSDLDRYIAERLHITEDDVKRATAQADQEIQDGNTKPQDRQRRIDEILVQSRSADIRMEMERFGLEATLNNDPQGFMGDLAKAAIQMRAKYPLLRPFIPFLRIAPNVANMFLQHSPAGLVQLLRQRPEGMAENLPSWLTSKNKRLTYDQWQMLRARVLISHAVGMALLMIAASFADDDDPAFQITGSFDQLSPEKRKQLAQQGIRPYQIRIGGTGFDYRQTPGAMLFATIGYYMDSQRYAPTDASLARKTASALGRGAFVVLDQQFLSGLTGFMNRPYATSESLGILDNLIKQSTRAAAGLIPTITKDLDRMVNPTDKEVRGYWGYLQREIPIARWALDDRINILGESYERAAYPWSWLISTKPDDVVWDALSEKAARNVFVPAVSSSATVVERGKRRKMNNEEFRRYQIETGKLYRQKLTKDLDRFRRMTPEQAKVYFEKEFAPLREQARAKIRASPTPSLVVQ